MEPVKSSVNVNLRIYFWMKDFWTKDKGLEDKAIKFYTRLVPGS
jgi:hypothetical protein